MKKSTYLILNRALANAIRPGPRDDQQRRAMFARMHGSGGSVRSGVPARTNNLYAGTTFVSPTGETVTRLPSAEGGTTTFTEWLATGRPTVVPGFAPSLPISTVGRQPPRVGGPAPVLPGTGAPAPVSRKGTPAPAPVNPGPAPYSEGGTRHPTEKEKQTPEYKAWLEKRKAYENTLAPRKGGPAPVPGSGSPSSGPGGVPDFRPIIPGYKPPPMKGYTPRLLPPTKRKGE